MRRTVISLALLLGANAIGLIVAAALLDKMELDFSAFIFALIIFTVIEAIATPGVGKLAETKAPAISSGVALIATFVALLVTDVLSDGLDIEGAGTWVLATLIVWVCTMVATLVLQKFFGPARGKAAA
jgi:uncharacterized membrane protein YvlD (DUF360 family)